MIPATSPIAGLTNALPPQVGADPANLAAVTAQLFGNPPERAEQADPYQDVVALL